MTPFDPDALLAMLLAFYPIVGPAALRRARTERPEYFSGGEIIGAVGQHLRIPDGRVYDCIFNVGGADTRWHMLLVEVDGAAPDADDPFALEEGPLTPIDESAFVPPAPGTPFEDLWGDVADELGDPAGELEATEATIAAGAAPADLEARLSAPIDAALDGIWQQAGALDAIVPDDELSQAAAQGGSIPGTREEYNDPPPPDIPGADELPPPPTEPDTQEV